MRAFKIILAIMLIVPFSTGAANFLAGAAVINLSGSVPPLSLDALNNPSLNSQLRFLGAIWFSSGVLAVFFLKDIERYVTLARVVLISIIVGGIGRVISAVQFGLPSPIFVAAMLVELIAVPVMLWWHFRLFPHTHH